MANTIDAAIDNGVRLLGYEMDQRHIIKSFLDIFTCLTTDMGSLPVLFDQLKQHCSPAIVVINEGPSESLGSKVLSAIMQCVG